MAEDDVQLILATADDWSRAIVANDADAIGRYMTDDWVIVSGTGVASRNEFLSFVESGDLTHDAMETIDGTARVCIYGETALFTARVTNTAHYQGQRFDADEWTTDVFVKVGDAWRCVLSHITSAESPEALG